MTKVFDVDITANQLNNLGDVEGPLGQVLDSLIDEWVGDDQARYFETRIGTVYGERTNDGTFQLRIVFRHSNSVK